MEAFIVEIQTGEYDDYRTTACGVFFSREKAEAFAAAVNTDLKRLEMHYDNVTESTYMATYTLMGQQPINVDYTGANARVVGPLPTEPELVRDVFMRVP